MEGTEVKTAFRIGVVKEGACRPIKVVLENKKETRKKILNNAKFIKHKVPDPLKNVIITNLRCLQVKSVKDLTWRQREVNKARLRQRRLVTNKDTEEPLQPQRTRPYNQQDPNQSRFNEMETDNETVIGGTCISSERAATLMATPGSFSTTFYQCK
ncbi:MAG: hypothetical protein ABW185_12205 [Sedimenticola sp.]